MRRNLRAMLEGAGFDVSTAHNGQHALDMIARVDPDVVTLDINMPVMDGLTCLSHIMVESPRPVVMVSSLTDRGALATFEALELGAVDYVSKPDGTVSLSIERVTDELVAKVNAAAGARSLGLSRRVTSQQSAAAFHQRSRVAHRPLPTRAEKGLVLIGVSTGGPRVLETILSQLPAGLPWPVVIAQHMPKRFTRVFAERMDRYCQLEVREVSSPIPLEPGVALIGKGDADVIIGVRGGRRVALCVPPDKSPWHPSVNRMVRSAMKHYKADHLIGVQLTGMGDDGAAAMAELHVQGGRTIAESEESAVVYGMPRVLIEQGGATRILHADQVAEQLTAWLPTTPTH
ncbi:MAG: chemotaxis response regulator protein-glutamate methylesterase [Myxococcales bacterium]|nr:chemotaxis response regulator protein-glutamate methylesterase [Myxococcales bacterium]